MLYNFDDLSFKILSVQHIKHEKGVFSVLPRPFSALSFKLKGIAKFKINNDTTTVFPGNIIYLSSNVGYEVEYTESEMIVIHFAECNYNVNFECFDFENTTSLQSHFNKILSFWNSQECIYDINAEMFSLLSVMRKTKQNNTFHNAFYSCVKHINENYTNPNLHIDTICRHYGISPANLRLKFNIVYNLPPKKYLLKLRLSHALRLLSENLYTIEEISAASGFNDTKYFSKVIKEYYGLPPSVLAKNLTK